MQENLVLKLHLAFISKMENAIQYLIKKEPVFKQLYEKYGIPFIPSRPQGFETLCKLILEQQVSLASAKACYLKLLHFLGEINPEKILKISLEDLRINGISKQKSVYLKALSEAILSKQLDLNSFQHKDVDKVRSELIQIKGIGNWTIDIYLMFALNAPDIIPVGDIAIVNTIKELYTVNSKEEIERITLNWKPYRSMASYFLWHHYLESRGRKPLIY